MANVGIERVGPIEGMGGGKGGKGGVGGGGGEEEDELEALLKKIRRKNLDQLKVQPLRPLLV